MVRGVQRWMDRDLGVQVPGRDHPAQRGEQRVLAHERGPCGGESGGGAVAEGDRADLGARVERRLEQGVAEGALRPAAPSAALREDRDAAARAEQGGDFGDRRRELPEAFAVDEDGAAVGGEPAQYGVGGDVGLGHHPDRAHRGEQRDVQPGDVVGDQQSGTRCAAATAGRRATATAARHKLVDAYPHPGRADECSGPAPYHRRTPAGRRRERDARDQHSAQRGPAERAPRGPRRAPTPPRGQAAQRGAGRGRLPGVGPAALRRGRIRHGRRGHQGRDVEFREVRELPELAGLREAGDGGHHGAAGAIERKCRR